MAVGHHEIVVAIEVEVTGCHAESGGALRRGGQIDRHGRIFKHTLR